MDSNVSLKDKITIQVEVGTFATLIAGIYCMYASVDPIAIPTSVYIELCEKLLPFLENWNYEKWSLEQWIQTSLLIAPKEFFSETELEELKNNEIYFERENGRIILVVTAGV